MSSDFLTGLSNQLEDKYGLGENQNRSLGVLQDGHVRQYAKLGDFAKKFDQTAERKYLEEGYLRRDTFNVDPKLFEILTQEPDYTILVKKRAFSTLTENNRPDFMDADEKLFYKSSKILFQNKCRQISAFEKLSKIERVGAAAGQLDDQLIPLIISLVDEVQSGFSNVGSAITGADSDFLNNPISQPFKQLSNTIDTVRKIYAFSGSTNYTTWVADNTNLFQTDYAQGTGVIELTNATNFRTTTSVNANGGNFSINIVDPYELMLITNVDIEQAISDALNAFDNSKTFQLGKKSLDRIAAENIKTLNDARAARKVSNINFIINPDAFQRKKVTAIFEGPGIEVNFSFNETPSLSDLVSGGGVTVSTESLRGGPEVGVEGLDTGTLHNQNGIAPLIVSNSEVSLFSDAVSAIFNSLDLKQTSKSNIRQNSELTNYARKKLRFHYGNKLIIQPMDQVHIYIGSKSRTDDKLLSGLNNMFTGLGFFQKLDTTTFDLKNQFNTLFNPSQNLDLQLEKSIFVGSNFPSGLWAMMRNLFTSDKSGAHVFAGVIDESSQHFSDGKFTVSVSGKDNTAYFDYGVVNLQPGIDNFNGPLYDPLTPFVTRFDAVSSNFKGEHPDFLAENKAIMKQTFSKGLVKHKSGRNAGKPVTMNNFFEDKEFTKLGVSKNVYYAPDGLVYKWKEGIGILVQYGDSFNSTDPEKVASPAVTSDTFAGQDIMNVLSLLITGEPYNYATFFKAVSEFYSFGKNSQTGQNASNSFYTTLRSNLEKRNNLWGNFIPFKGFTVDEKTFSKVLDSQFTIINTNAQVDQLLQQIQDTKNKLFSIQAGTPQGGTPPPQATLLQNTLTNLNNQLATQQSFIQNTMAASGTPMSIVGNDVSFDPSQITTSQSYSLSNPSARREVRRRTNFLTRRLSWQVRANDDKNLLIIDDSYDKDYDILAFEKSMATQLRQYSSEYSTIRDKINNVAQLLNLEVFADTQGHIRIRPPQYNRMPSSVFYRMMQLRQQTGIQIFPQFLEDLFVDQVQSLITRLEIIEDQIRLDAAIIGKNSDQDIQNFLRGSEISSAADFEFISDPSGNIGDVSSIIGQSTPDLGGAPTDIQAKLNAQGALATVFTTQTRAAVVTSILNNGPTTIFMADRINTIRSRLFSKTGQQVSMDGFIQSSQNTFIASPSNNIDVFKVTKDLADKVSERQKIIKSAASAVKNAQESTKLDGNDPTTSNQLLFPDLYGNKQVPEIFENMIEDESYDDYGPGAGGRYIIHNYQIISMDIQETPPDFTAIEVQGQLDPYIGRGNLPEGLNSFPQGGNGLITAAGVDYDTWRMYGYRTRSAITVPFLSNPQNQCAPYAATLLSQARKRIFHGSVTIAGNEFMQPGEVVFLENRGMLFYVEVVSHDFAEGNAFRTTLNLTYGHNPGEYIPTSLDVIGKMLYNNRDTASYVNYRQKSVFNETPMGAIIVNDASDFSGITGGNSGEQNLNVISNILYTAYGVVTKNSIATNNVNPVVELRIFFDSSAGGIDPNLNNQVNNLQGILNGTLQIDVQDQNTKVDLYIPNSNIKIVQVDISNIDEFRSPSQVAFNSARDQAKNISLGLPSQTSQNSDAVQKSLFTFIIDCVMTFNNTSITGT